MITLLRSLLAVLLPLALTCVVGCGSSGAVSGPVPSASGMEVQFQTTPAPPMELLPLLTTEEYDRMLEMSPAQALARYGQTIEGYLCRDCEFTLTPSVELFRFELLTRFNKEEVESETIQLREMTWKVDTFRNLTIWYWIHAYGHFPIHQMVWNRTWRFDTEESSDCAP